MRKVLNRSGHPQPMEYTPCLDWLLGLETMGIKLGLSNITELLHRLGDPQDSFRSVHVAGSNGKGSVSAMTASILKEEGYRTGLYTSPHLVDFRERIQVGGAMISVGELARLTEEVRGQAEDMFLASPETHVTFFEASTAIAFLHFAGKGVEQAAVEVGMGGRLDATNVLKPDCSVITRISMEHVKYLGDTIARIAAEKAGIIKPGVPVVTAAEGEALALIERAAADAGSVVRVVGRDVRYDVVSSTLDGTMVRVDGLDRTVALPLLGSYQASNAAMAIVTCHELRGRGVAIAEEAIINGLEKVRWPGRLEIVRKRPTVIFDVSHTPDGARAVAADLEKLLGTKVILVLGVLDDKDVKGIAEGFGRIAKRAIATAPLTWRAYPANVVAEALRSYVPAVEEGPSVADSLRMALSLASPDDAVLVTGSLYTVGEAMAWWRGHEAGKEDR
jgi:dihydrofolate synthase/folylpolyglutamate synthase